MIALLAATASALSSTSHRIYPGRLGTAFRIKGCVPREDALAIGKKALALPPSAWASDRHASYATLDCSAHEVEPDFDSIVWSRVRARLAAVYELPEPSLCLIDAFVVRYDAAAGESAELAPHRDAGPLSFNVLLSDGSDFDGGATTFVDAEFDGVDATPRTILARPATCSAAPGFAQLGSDLLVDFDLMMTIPIIGPFFLTMTQLSMPWILRFLYTPEF